MKLSISENISRLRKANSMTQERLAEALGVTFAAVSKWERGAATPELSYIVEMADLFGVSVDALLGYRVQSGACEAVKERIYSLQKQKAFADAAAEAEKALTRYPNDFGLVHRCGEMYHFMSCETGDRRAAQRAIGLLERAVLLLSQNTDPQISEFGIQEEIAQCYIVLGRQAEALELLKKYNVGGVHNALIGLTCSVSEACGTEEAAPYLTEAFFNCSATLVRTMTGYANYYARKEDYAAALDAVLWLLRYLESLRSDGETVSYVDKICAPFFAECARLSLLLGETGAVEPYLQKALKFAVRFDAAPVYSVCSMKFCIRENGKPTIYDDMGATATQAVENLLLQEDWSDELRLLWQKLKAGGYGGATVRNSKGDYIK